MHVYNIAYPARQGVKASTDARVLKVIFSLNWTGPYKVMRLFPFPLVTPDGSMLGDKLLYLHLPGGNYRRRCAQPRLRRALQAPCQPP